MNQEKAKEIIKNTNSDTIKEASLVRPIGIAIGYLKAVEKFRGVVEAVKKAINRVDINDTNCLDSDTDEFNGLRRELAQWEKDI